MHRKKMIGADASYSDLVGLSQDVRRLAPKGRVMLAQGIALG